MAGLIATKIQGRTGGAPKGLKGLTVEAQQQALVAELLYMEGYAIKLIAQQLNISRTTVYKYLAYREVNIKKQMSLD